MDMPRLAHALALLPSMHEGQETDGSPGLPYVIHPAELVSLLRWTGSVTDEEVLVAAALHDVLEHGCGALEQIRGEFGERVADLVQELTREEPTAAEIEGLPKEAIWRLRSEMLLREIEDMSPSAKLIKLADRISNLQMAGHAKKGRKLTRYLDQTEEILRIIPRRTNRQLWDHLRDQLDHLKDR